MGTNILKFEKNVKIEGERYCEFHIVGSPTTYKFDKKRQVVEVYVLEKLVGKFISEITAKEFFEDCKQIYNVSILQSARLN
jgi:hypothetical protein